MAVYWAVVSCDSKSCSVGPTIQECKQMRGGSSQLAALDSQPRIQQEVLSGGLLWE